MFWIEYEPEDDLVELYIQYRPTDIKYMEDQKALFEKYFPFNMKVIFKRSTPILVRKEKVETSDLTKFFRELKKACKDNYPLFYLFAINEKELYEEFLIIGEDCLKIDIDLRRLLVMAWNIKATEDNFDICVKAVHAILQLEDNPFNRENIKFMVGGIADRRKKYLLSEGAYEILQKVKPKRIVGNMAKGSVKGVTIEHMIPNSVVVDYLYENKNKFKDIETLSKYLKPLNCALVSTEENAKLKQNGLNQAMPSDWQGDTENSIMARYNEVNIKII